MEASSLWADFVAAPGDTALVEKPINVTESAQLTLKRKLEEAKQNSVHDLIIIKNSCPKEAHNSRRTLRFGEQVCNKVGVTFARPFAEGCCFGGFCRGGVVTVRMLLRRLLERYLRVRWPNHQWRLMYSTALVYLVPNLRR